MREHIRFQRFASAGFVVIVEIANWRSSTEANQSVCVPVRKKRGERGRKRMDSTGFEPVTPSV